MLQFPAGGAFPVEAGTVDRLFRVFLPPHPPVSLFSSVVANVRPWAGKPGLEGPLPPALESFLSSFGLDNVRSIPNTPLESFVPAHGMVVGFFQQS